MKKKMTTVDFHGTKDQEKMLADVICEYRDVKGALMPVLQKAQNIYGYLPIEAQKMIAEGMGVSLEEIYGIVTFYSQFSLNPKGSVSIAVCLGTACYVKGSGAILQRIADQLGVPPGETSGDGKYSLEATRCIGACGLAPAMIVNEEVYGRLLKPEDVDPIIEKYKN